MRVYSIYFDNAEPPTITLMAKTFALVYIKAVKYADKHDGVVNSITQTAQITEVSNVDM